MLTDIWRGWELGLIFPLFLRPVTWTPLPISVFVTVSLIHEDGLVWILISFLSYNFDEFNLSLYRNVWLFSAFSSILRERPHFVLLWNMFRRIVDRKWNTRFYQYLFKFKFRKMRYSAQMSTSQRHKSIAFAGASNY